MGKRDLICSFVSREAALCAYIFIWGGFIVANGNHWGSKTTPGLCVHADIIVKLHCVLEKDNLMLFFLGFRIPTDCSFSTLVFEGTHSTYMKPPDFLILLSGYLASPVFLTPIMPSPRSTPDPDHFASNHGWLT